MLDLTFCQTAEGQFLCDATGRVVATIWLGGLAGQALGDAIVAACQAARDRATRTAEGRATPSAPAGAAHAAD